MKKFNGQEVAFLMGLDEENPYDGILEEEELGENNGYEERLVVVKHPDGKLYQFAFEYNTEHGVCPYSEWPQKEIEAYEVRPVEKIIVSYERIE